MTFITIDSKVTFDEHFLNIKKVKHDPSKRYWFDSFLLLAFFIGFQTYRAIYDKPRAWIWVLIGLTWIYPHLERVLKILFVYKWGDRVELEKIKKFTILPLNNDLETTLRLELFNGRQKLLTFRTAEDQVNRFTEMLQQKATNLIL